MLMSACKKEPERIIIDFEDMNPGTEGFWNGSDGRGSFTSGKATFPNHYDSEWNFWSGFAYTNHKDNKNFSTDNMYSSIAGGGAGGSDNYAVYYYYSEFSDTIWFDTEMKIEGISISNTAYAYFAMLQGDAFSKKFGGETGNDKDWYKVILKAIDRTGKIAVGHVEIMLADYRFDDNTRDYIANVWTDIDLSVFGYIKGLTVKIESSDTGEYGINTPAYFCLDNIVGVLPGKPE